MHLLALLTWSFTASRCPGLHIGPTASELQNLHSRVPLALANEGERRRLPIIPPEHPHNIAWGDAGGRTTLYMTSQTGLYRIRPNSSGICP